MASSSYPFGEKKSRISLPFTLRRISLTKGRVVKLRSVGEKGRSVGIATPGLVV
jgi:hypothetical protein